MTWRDRVLASVVSAFYYLRIVKVMYFDDPAEEFETTPRELRLVILLSGVFVVVFAVVSRPLITAAEAAAASLF